MIPIAIPIALCILSIVLLVPCAQLIKLSFEMFKALKAETKTTILDDNTGSGTLVITKIPGIPTKAKVTELGVPPGMKLEGTNLTAASGGFNVDPSKTIEFSIKAIFEAPNLAFLGNRGTLLGTTYTMLLTGHENGSNIYSVYDTNGRFMFMMKVPYTN